MDEKLIRTRTREGLPLVTKETREAFSKNLEVEVMVRDCPSTILKEWINEIGEENPELIKYASELVERYPPEERGPILASVFSIYELLKSQALNDKIKKYFGVGYK